eukprot:CAMPEP_0198118564 /NCGR_PEP_ID=MMETSP1442-20131203/22196_1 /TAXON_ID= /ORGANISM="Craspedostauros australis, Strain CCMP3328" /LENGTH=268 /DNA_ID=CAMNT_0043776845 /DNA_START=225 /DNA_END=1031 /DNA_ORIENTATION=-
MMQAVRLPESTMHHSRPSNAACVSSASLSSLLFFDAPPMSTSSITSAIHVPQHRPQQQPLCFSSCGMEAIHVNIPMQQPMTPSTSTGFDWADMAVVEVEDDHSQRQRHCMESMPQQLQQHQSHSSSTASNARPSFQSPQEDIALQQQATMTATPCMPFATQQQQPTDQPQRKCSHSRRVTFAPDLEVRMYPIVLGDHPSCSDSLPIQLGWEYSSSSDSDDSDDDEDVSEWTLDAQEQRLRQKQHQFPYTHRVRRLSFLERREMLQSAV